MDKVTHGLSREREAEQDPCFWMLVNVVTHKQLVAHTAAEHFDLMDRDKVCMVHFVPSSLFVSCKNPAPQIMIYPNKLNIAEAQQDEFRQKVKK